MRVKEKTLVIIAGPNGSGKSVFHKHLGALEDLPFVNADNIAKENFKIVGEKESREAQKIAASLIEQHLSTAQSFCFETVFSHPSKLDLIHSAKLLDYHVILLVISPGNQDLNILRVMQRVQEGGHDVPQDRILSRIPKTMANLKKALPLVDAYQIIDSSQNNTFTVLAKKEFDGPLEVLTALSPWAEELLENEQPRALNQASRALQDMSERLSTAVSAAISRDHKTCKKCGAPLRGRPRKKYGICSTCEPRPKYKR